MSYREIGPTVVDLEYGEDPHKFLAWLLLILFMLSLIVGWYVF